MILIGADFYECMFIYVLIYITVKIIGADFYECMFIYVFIYLTVFMCVSVF